MPDSVHSTSAVPSEDLPELPPLPPVPEGLGRYSIDIFGYAQDYAKQYATAAVMAERQAAWEAVNSMIREGRLQGHGWDDTAQRNGVIIAANVLQARCAK